MSEAISGVFLLRRSRMSLRSCGLLAAQVAARAGGVEIKRPVYPELPTGATDPPRMKQRRDQGREYLSLYLVNAAGSSQFLIRYSSGVQYGAPSFAGAARMRTFGMRTPEALTSGL